MSTRDLLLPAPRLERWVDNFTARHGPTSLVVSAGRLVGTAADTSRFEAALPFAASYDGSAEVAAFAAAVAPPTRWGVLLVRKGGFAVARLADERVSDSKVGQRHVQSRTKAGGQSQQRFARRRDNQARVANEAAAEHAARILPGVHLVVTGGDHTAVDAVLADPRLADLVVTPPWLPVPDPRRAVLDQAVVDACSVQVRVDNSG